MDFFQDENDDIDIEYDVIMDSPNVRNVLYDIQTENLEQITRLSSLNFIFPTNEILINIYNDYLNNRLLTQGEFNKLPKHNCKFECPVCLDEKEDGVILSCNHIFCTNCLNKWLTQKNTLCPLCRENGKKDEK